MDTDALADAIDDIAAYGEARALTLRELAAEVRTMSTPVLSARPPVDPGMTAWIRETRLAEQTKEARIATLQLLAGLSRSSTVVAELRVRWPWWRRVALAWRLISPRWPE